jgi:protein KRI1
MEEHDDQDEGKPSWGEDIDIDDIIPSPNTSEEKIVKKRKSKKKRESADDDDVGVDVDAMDADNQAHRFNEEEEQWDGTEEMRKRKLDEYMDELYAMEFNDMVCGTLFYRNPYKSNISTGRGNAHTLQIYYQRTGIVRTICCRNPCSG